MHAPIVGSSRIRSLHARGSVGSFHSGHGAAGVFIPVSSKGRSRHGSKKSTYSKKPVTDRENKSFSLRINHLVRFFVRGPIRFFVFLCYFQAAFERREAGLTSRLFLLENEMEKTEKRTTAKPTTRTELFTASEAAGENVLRAFAGQVRDVDGVWFDVYEARVTMHGFDLLFGAPDASHALCEPNRQHLIVTPELRDFWLNNRAQGRGFLYDLPAGKTTIGNARRRLGLNWFADQRTFWTERIEDLR